MAYNEITLPKLQDLVRRRFGLTGPGGNVPVLASEIQPVAIVEPVLPEHELLRSVLHFTGTIYNITSANNRWITVAILNPVGSNKIVLVERIWSNNQHAVAVPQWPLTSGDIYVNNEAVNTAITTFAVGPNYYRPQDTRRFDKLSVVQGWSGDFAIAGFPAVSAAVASAEFSLGEYNGTAYLNSRAWWNEWHLLLPGWGIGYRNISAAGAGSLTAVQVGFKWREFDAERAEVTA